MGSPKELLLEIHRCLQGGFLKAGIIVGVLTLGLSPPAQAEPDAHRQAAEQVLKLTRAHRMLEPMIRQMQERQLKQLEQMNLPNEARAITEKYIIRMNELIKAELAWDNMKDEYISLYTKAFSEEELVQLAQFFKSSIGQKMVDKNPDLMHEVMLLGQSRLMKIIPEMQALSREMVQELKAHEKR